MSANLMQGPKTSAMQMVEKLLENRAWLDRNIDEVVTPERVGKWIGIRDQKVVAVEASAAKVKQVLGGEVGEALVIFGPKDIPAPI